MDHDRSDLKCTRETWHVFEPLNNFPLVKLPVLFFYLKLKAPVGWKKPRYRTAYVRSNTVKYYTVLVIGLRINLSKNRKTRNDI